MARVKWPWSKVVTFVLLTFGISSVFYVLMYSTGSARDIGALWMWSPGVGAILTHNLFIQEAFLHMSFDTGPTEFVVDDFGLGLVLAALALGYVFWRKRSELSRAVHMSLGKAS